MNIEQVEYEIKSIYTWYAEQAPGVTPQEQGPLADLWALADQLYADE